MKRLAVSRGGSDRRRRFRHRAFASVVTSSWLSRFLERLPRPRSRRDSRESVLIALSPAVISTRIEGFRQGDCPGLKELGYIGGRNIVLEYRTARRAISTGSRPWERSS